MHTFSTLLKFTLKLCVQSGKLGFRVLAILVPVIGGALWQVVKAGPPVDDSDDDESIGSIPEPGEYTHPGWQDMYGYHNPSFHPGYDK